MLVQWIFFFLSVTISFLFFLYGFNHYYLLSKAHQYKKPLCLDSNDIRPSVSIHLPIYNEKYVIHRLMKACTGMVELYGIDKARIVILDDSNDDTTIEIDKVVEAYRRNHFNIDIYRRESRQGFKAGALQKALERTPEDFIAIFDADFTPPADFLVRTLPYFAQDGNIGIVQSRWGHLNRDFNILTRGTAILMDIHFIIEQTGRYAAGFFQNFNGSGGVLRKKAMLEAGGWQADTLAEDLDLSYRMQLRGYKVLYLRDLQSPGEIPPTIPSYKQQQSRWACGSLRAARKILPILAQHHEIDFKKRLQAFIHLTGYFIHPLMAISFVLACLSTFLSVGAINNSPYPNVSLFHENIGTAFITTSMFQDITWLILVPFIFLCTIAPWVSALKTLQMQKLPLIRNLPSLMALFLLGFGASLNNTIGAGRALFSNQAYEWTRTPKYADLQNAESWRTKKYQTAPNYIWLLESVFAGIGTIACAFAIRNSNFTVLLILVPFTVAYAFVSLLSFRQS